MYIIHWECKCMQLADMIYSFITMHTNFLNAIYFFCFKQLVIEHLSFINVNLFRMSVESDQRTVWRYD